MLFLPLGLFYKTMGLLDEVNYNNNNSYNNNYKKKGQHKQHCLHTYNNCIRNVVSVVLFLFSVVVSFSKTQPHLKHKLVISTQLSLCLKRAEWGITEKF